MGRAIGFEPGEVRRPAAWWCGAGPDARWVRRSRTPVRPAFNGNPRSQPIDNPNEYIQNISHWRKPIVSLTPSQSRSRQSDSAYERLRLMIIRTELPPGALIEEAAMMEHLGVGPDAASGGALPPGAGEPRRERSPPRAFRGAALRERLLLALRGAPRARGVSARLAARRVSPDLLERLAALVEELARASPRATAIRCGTSKSMNASISSWPMPPTTHI